MLGTRTIIVSLLLGAVAFAVEPDYFPLHPGNQWVYRCTGNCGDELPVLEIARDGWFNGTRYALLKGFNGRQTWLRQDESGVLWAFDPDSGLESRWYSFFAPVEERFDTSADPCSRSAAIVTRDFDYRGPTGRFDDVLQLRYEESACADAGINEEYFLPWTGIVRRIETTIAGPRTYDLIYSRTGGVTVIAEPHLSFALHIDQPLYDADFMPPVDPVRSVPVMTARIALTNTTDQPVSLVWPSGQRYDLEIRNELGEVISRWSDGKAFPAVSGEEKFGPGERNYTILVPLAGRDMKTLPPGRYTVTAWLATEPVKYRASVGFEVRHVF
jgi:Intracellular proteinase inhibitor